MTWASVTGIGHLFSPAAVGQRFDQVTSAKAASQAAADGTRPSSIVGIGGIATDALHAGVGDYLYILIVINIFFGMFNLFPMLPLDGGHVAIAVYEKIRTGRRKVMYHADVAKLMPFTWVFMLFLAVLIVPAFLPTSSTPWPTPSAEHPPAVGDRRGGRDRSPVAWGHGTPGLDDARNAGPPVGSPWAAWPSAAGPRSPCSR